MSSWAPSTQVIQATPRTTPTHLQGAVIPTIAGRKRVVWSAWSVAVGISDVELDVAQVIDVFGQPNSCPRNEPLLVVYYQQQRGPSSNPTLREMVGNRATHALVIYPDPIAVFSAWQSFRNHEATTPIAERLICQGPDLRMLLVVKRVRRALNLAGVRLCLGPFPLSKNLRSDEKVQNKAHLAEAQRARRQLTNVDVDFSHHARSNGGRTLLQEAENARQMDGQAKRISEDLAKLHELTDHLVHILYQ